MDFYDYAVTYQLPFLVNYGLDYPNSGSWQPANEVIKTMDLDRFTIPVTVDWTDVRQPLNQEKEYDNQDSNDGDEVRLMLTARVSGDYLGEPLTKYESMRFTNSQYDSIIYEMHLLHDDNYSVVIPESFMDLVPEGMLKINETTPEGREQNANFQKVAATTGLGSTVRIEKFSDMTPLRIKIQYERLRNKTLITPLRIQAEINSEPRKWVIRKRFTEAADGQDYEVESFSVHHPNTEKIQTYVWVPRPTLGLMNWWPTLP